MEQPNATVITFNLSSSGLLPYLHWNYKTVIPVVVLSLCCILGVPGNIGVILLKPNWHHLSSLSQILMLNLAISDMLCLLTLPLWIYSLLYGWSFGLVACKLLAYRVYCGIWGSQLTMTALSIQRYLTVVRQRRFSQMQKRVLLVLLWMAAAILSTPVLVVRQLSTDQHWIVCGSQYFSQAQGVIVLLAETLFNFFSFCLIALLYIRLLRKVNQAAFFKNPQTTRLVTSIIISFLVLWTPFHIINVLGMAAMCLKNKSLFAFCIDTWNIVKALTFVSSCLNPFLYAFTSKLFLQFANKRSSYKGRSFRTPKHQTYIQIKKRKA